MTTLTREAVTVATGHCSRCHKIWTLETKQGVCPWCGKPSTCQSQIEPRHIKSSRRQKPSRTIPDYHGLTGEWASYYKVALAYQNRVPAQDRQDIRHDIMIELDRATKRDGKPLPELRAFRIASLTVALYYRQQNRFSKRVCIYNGYPQILHCKDCQNKNGKPCCWLATRPVESLDAEIIDPEGYRSKLMDTVATEQAIDLPPKWYEVNEVKQGLPLRLVEIGYKRLNKIPLTNSELIYLCRYWKTHQKRLF